MEKISIIIPAYNSGQWLPRCLDSLLVQTYQNLELIVVNDGSTDNTRVVLADYEARYPNIKVIHKENGGDLEARMTGVQYASGEWIGFTDSDDEVEPDMYERLYHNACKYNAQISHCGFKVIYSDGRVRYLNNTGLLRVQDRNTALRDLLEDKIVENGLPNKMFRRELFEGLWEKMNLCLRNNSDMLMNFYLFEKAERAVYEDVCPYHYLIRQGSTSRRKLNRHIIYDPITVRQRIVEDCDPKIRNDARAELARMCLISYRQIVVDGSSEFDEDKKRVRELICQQLPYLAVIPLRNALVILLICYVPKIFDILYPRFEKWFRQE